MHVECATYYHASKSILGCLHHLCSVPSPTVVCVHTMPQLCISSLMWICQQCPASSSSVPLVAMSSQSRLRVKTGSSHLPSPQSPQSFRKARCWPPQPSLCIPLWSSTNLISSQTGFWCLQRCIWNYGGLKKCLLLSKEWGWGEGLGIN